MEPESGRRLCLMQEPGWKPAVAKLQQVADKADKRLAQFAARLKR